jgi:hypothetical protein
MLLIHAHVQVKPERVEAFNAASIDHARHSVPEPRQGVFTLSDADGLP